MIGILTEKLSAARNFAKALGGMSGTYNGQAYTIVSARGHLYEFVDPSEQVDKALANKYHSWDVALLPWQETDFKWKKKLKSGAQTTVTAIKNTLSQCEEVVIATDVDPTGEGELLAWEILDAIKVRPRVFSRMYFMDETVSSIQKAFVGRKKLPSMNQDMDYVKANYRSQWDFLSMQWTRIATACGDGRSVLRQGRLKSAMVVFVGDALKALHDYKKVPFYQNRFRDENGVMYTNREEQVFPKKEDVPQTYRTSGVTVDSRIMKSTAPPKLLDLAGLSAIMENAGFSAGKVLDVYQKMYEAQIVSYPRTEDTVITPEQFNELLPKADAIAKVVGVDTSLLTHRSPRKTHVKTGGAHGANRPGPNVPVSLSVLSSYGAEGPMIYELLARSYLTMLAEDYEYEAQSGHVTDYPKFTGSATVPKKMGWKAVYHDADLDDASDNAKGLGRTAEPFVYEGFPPKPPTPTWKWLSDQLKRYKVGTGATQTSCYKEITDSSAKYPLMRSQRGRLTLTNFGQMSYGLLPGTFIGDIKTTEQLQAQMCEVGAGMLSPADGLARIQGMILADMEVMKKNSVVMRKELGVTMENGNGNVQKEKFSGMWNGKPVGVNRVYGGHRFTDEECERLLAGEEILLTDCVSSSGKPFQAKGKLADLTYNGHKYVGFDGKIVSENGESSGGAYPQKEKFEGTWKRKKVSVNRVYCGHRFTDEECKDLLAGKEIEILGLKSQSTGKEYGVRGKLSKQTYNGHEFVGFERLGFATGGASSIPEKFCEHVFSEDEMALLEAGKPVAIEGFVSKKGSVFNAKIRYGEREDGRKGIIIDEFL